MYNFFANQLSTTTIKKSSLITLSKTTIIKMSGPYAMFGPGRIIETIPFSTSKNGRMTEYKITDTKHFLIGNK